MRKFKHLTDQELEEKKKEAIVKINLAHCNHARLGIKAKSELCFIEAEIIRRGRV